MEKYIVVKKNSLFSMPDTECTFNTLEEARQFANLLNKNRGDKYNSYHVYSLVEEKQA